MCLGMVREDKEKQKLTSNILDKLCNKQTFLRCLLYAKTVLGARETSDSDSDRLCPQGAPSKQ